MIPLRTLVLALLGVLGAMSFGARPSDGNLVGRGEHSILKRLGAELGWEDAPVTSGVNVIVRQGGAYVSVLAIGPISGDAKRLAESLESGTGHDDAVYSQEDDCSAALLSWNSAKFGLTHAESSVDTDAIGRALAPLAGREPPRIAVLRARHAEGGLAESFRAKRWSIAAPAKGISKVTATLHPLTIPLAIFFLLFMPIAGVAGFLGAVLAARNTRLPKDVRRRRFLALVRTVPIGAMAIHAPIAIFVMLGGWLYPLGDLWFGSQSILAIVSPFVLGMPIPLFALLPLVNRYEKRLFESEPSVDGTANVAPVRVEPTDAERSHQRLVMRARGGVLLVAVALMGASFLAPSRSDWGRVALVIGLLTVGLSSFVTLWLVKQFGPKIVESEDAPELEAIARSLAGNEASRVRSVRINVTAVGRAAPGGSVTTDGRITITRRATEILEPAELRALLAHEVAHVVLRKGLPSRTVIIAGGIAFVVAFTAISTLLPQYRLFVLMPMLLILPAQMLLMPGRMQRREMEVDRLAVGITGDPEALVRCLEKCATASPMSGYAQVDTATHPAHARRIAAIRSAGRASV